MYYRIFCLLFPIAYWDRNLIRQWKSKTVRISLGILAALSLMIAVSNFPVIKESMKINKDTEAYYEYIHEYNKNFMNFRY